MRKLSALVVALSGLFAAPWALAQDSGMWLLRARASQLSPANSDGSGMGLSVNRKTLPELDFSVFITPSDAFELSLAVPRTHVVHSAAWGEDVGSFKLMPTTLTAQHHFTGVIGVRPYLGLGLAYGHISSVATVDGVMDFGRSSFGLAGQLGMDIPVGSGWLLNLDVKKLQIGTKVSYLGAELGKFRIDPLIVSLGVGKRF